MVALSWHEGTDDFIKFKLKFEFDNIFMPFFHLTDENHCKSTIDP